jgi:hypothetical protein
MLMRHVVEATMIPKNTLRLRYRSAQGKHHSFLNCKQ